MENIEELLLTEFPMFLRYYVFACYKYYPDGGIYDLQQGFNNEDDAKKYAKEIWMEKSFDYVNIHDVLVNCDIPFR